MCCVLALCRLLSDRAPYLVPIQSEPHKDLRVLNRVQREVLLHSMTSVSEANVRGSVLASLEKCLSIRNQVMGWNHHI